MSCIIKRLLLFSIALLVPICASAQVGNQGGFRTTNSPFPDAILITDGSKLYWGAPTNLTATATNTQPPSTILTNLSGTGAITNLNDNQFDGESTIATIRNGALVTNLISRGVTMPNLTADRAVGLNASGNLTNSPGVTMAELEFLDGVLEPIQTSILNLRGGTNGLDTRLTVVSNAFRTDIDNLQGATNGLHASIGVSSNALQAAKISIQGGAGNNNILTNVTAQLNLTAAGHANLLSNAMVGGRLFGTNGYSITGESTNNGNTVFQGNITMAGGGGDANLIMIPLDGYAPFLSMDQYGISGGSFAAPTITTRKANGTFAAPTKIVANNLVGQLYFAGRSGLGDNYNGALGLHAYAMEDYAASASKSLVIWSVGDATSNIEPVPVWWWTRYNSTNDANLIVNSNLFVGTGSGVGGLYVAGNSLLAGNLTNNGIATLNAVVGSGLFLWNGSLNSFEEDLTVQGPFIANESLRLPRAEAPVTDEFGEAAADNNAWAASRGAVQFFDGTANTYLVGVLSSDAPSNLQVPKFNSASGTITWEDDTTGSSTLTTNENQFGASVTVTIKNGALLTNLISRGVTIPTITSDRALMVNASGNITNSPGVTQAELEFLDGVTSSLQTQLDGKMNGQTNSAQFGASTVLTLRDGVTVTNVNVIGTLHVTNNPAGGSPALRLWQTNGLAYTEFALPVPWNPTNRYVFWQTNAAAGKLIKVNSVSISGGLATINITNDFAAGTEVTFSDPNSDFAATDVTSAIAELVSANGSGPNASDGKVNWSQLVSVPAGFADGTDAGGTNNPVQAVGTLILTNGTIHKPLDLGNNTNGVVSWNTNYYVWSPSNTFTLSWTDVPTVTDGRRIYLKIINTNSTAGYFPTNGLNNAPVILLSSPSTNEFTLGYDTNGFWISSGQILTTGAGDTNVFNVGPSILDLRIPGSGATVNYVWTCMNAATGEGQWTAVSVGSGGTNYPPFINRHGNTNVTVGSGVRQRMSFTTNGTFGLNFSGTPLNGEEIKVAVSNTSSSIIYMSNFVASTLTGIYDPTVASNVTSFAIAATSERFFSFVSGTNFNNGSQRWELESSSGKEMKLSVASSGGNGFLALSTNAAASIVTISNAYIPQNSSMVLSNLAANTIDTPGTGNILSNVNNIKFWIWTNYVQTVSNFVFSFNTNRYELKNQTNVVFTNIVEEATAVGAEMSVHIHNTTGVTMGLVWPAYGAKHGYFFQTNANNPILTTTTLASGSHGVASFTAFGTNIFATFTTWP